MMAGDPIPPRRQAAALRYQAGETPAPEVVARGQGHLAERIIALADAHGVPVHRSPQLVALLARLPLDEAIPPALYRAVAEVLVFLLAADAAGTGARTTGRRLPSDDR